MSYKFFENTECEYYPCHRMESINCLFCFCPLYNKEECGGDFVYTAGGIKDCSNCTYPHLPENYEKIIKKLEKGC